MTQTIADLTDKEKEALRLLVEGHDAKSSATVLGISVHTINDRLRNARRKLHVSSSREAARILRDAEGDIPQNAPQNDVRISLGIADEAGSPDTEILNQRSQKGSSRLVWLAGGMLIMSVLIAVAIFAAVSNTGGEGTSSAKDTSSAGETLSSASTNAASPAALARSQRFLNAVDAGNWAQSWNAAGDFFQSQTTADEWAAVVEPVRGPLGEVEERRLANVQKLQTLPGAPEGDYEVLTYQTVFSGADMISTETVIVVRNGDGFDVAGYFIR